jgi:excisionase family DNA binding protein
MKRKMNHFVNTEIIAAHYGIHPNTVRRWLAEGVPHVKCGRVYRFELGKVEAWLHAREKHEQAKAA